MHGHSSAKQQAGRLGCSERQAEGNISALLGRGTIQSPPLTQVCSDRYPDCLGLAM